MIDYPNCKINLGLRILGKRADGYHNIETVFYPVGLFDILEIQKSDEEIIETSGIKIDGKTEENICIKAQNIIRQNHQITGVKIYLHKEIPTGAGLGGGSSDGAFVLKMLNSLFSLNISHEILKIYAGTLGSDCAFFIKNKAAYATEKGDKLEEIELSLRNYYILIVKPNIHVSTIEAYKQLRITNKNGEGHALQTRASRSIKDIVRLPIEEWKDELSNDFEEVIFRQHPTLSKIKTKLYESGAVYASMSGSGSAMYGIYKEEPDEKLFDGDGFVWKGKML